MKKFGSGEQGFVSGNCSDPWEWAYLDWSTGKLWEILGDQDKARAYIGKVRLTGMSGSPKCADFRPVRIKIDD